MLSLEVQLKSWDVPWTFLGCTSGNMAKLMLSQIHNFGIFCRQDVWGHVNTTVSIYVKIKMQVIILLARYYVVAM